MPAASTGKSGSRREPVADRPWTACRRSRRPGPGGCPRRRASAARAPRRRADPVGAQAGGAPVEPDHDRRSSAHASCPWQSSARACWPQRRAGGKGFDKSPRRAISPAHRRPGAKLRAVFFVTLPPRVDDQAYRSQVEDLPPPRRQSVGPAEEPAGPPRLCAGRARPEAPQAFRLRAAAGGQAEAAGTTTPT